MDQQLIIYSLIITSYIYGAIFCTKEIESFKEIPIYMVVLGSIFFITEAILGIILATFILLALPNKTKSNILKTYKTKNPKNPKPKQKIKDSKSK